MNEAQRQLGLPLEQLPRHVAIVMDGNGRWAERQEKHRDVGHAKGAEAVLPIVTQCSDLGIEALTLYALSHENLVRRPEGEVECLMSLYEQYLRSERQQLVDNNVRFRHVGRREGLHDAVLAELDGCAEVSSRNTGLTLCLALNYGSRQEIVDAVRSIAEDVADGSMKPGEINESVIDSRLYTAGLPDPDLLIRTAGERRLSNFLLWQLSYAELWVTETLWPDFRPADLHDALRDFARRTRRYGAVVR